MKKILVLAIVTTLMTGLFFPIAKALAKEDVPAIKAAIAKYKQKNYIGCISDLRLYTTKDPTSAIAWYYLGTSYMNIAMKTDANFAFDRVIQLNTIPKLTSYAIQAKLCMDYPDKCNYQNFTYEEINQLRADPIGFIDQYNASKNQKEEVVKDIGELEIEKLIDGQYENNIHPAARDFIKQENLKIKQLKMNSDNQTGS